jgi:hypothetical protein
LKVNLLSFNNAANAGLPFVVLTDLDIHVKCPGQLLPKWLPNRTPSSNLIFRVAVKEVEAWLLGDSVNLANYLDVNPTDMPIAPEALPDPKVELVRLAGLSTSPTVRADMVPSTGSTAEVGPYFERMLINFVRHRWDIDAAAAKASSLVRALRALRSFRPT